MEGGGSGDSGLPRVLRVDYGLQGTVYYRVVQAPERCLPQSNLRRSVVNVNVCAWRVIGALGYQWVMVWVGKEWCAVQGLPALSPRVTYLEVDQDSPHSESWTTRYARPATVVIFNSSEFAVT